MKLKTPPFPFYFLNLKRLFKFKKVYRQGRNVINEKKLKSYVSIIWEEWNSTAILKIKIWNLLINYYLLINSS